VYRSMNQYCLSFICQPKPFLWMPNSMNASYLRFLEWQRDYGMGFALSKSNVSGDTLSYTVCRIHGNLGSS